MMIHSAGYINVEKSSKVSLLGKEIVTKINTKLKQTDNL